MTVVCFGVAALLEQELKAHTLSAMLYMQAIVGVTFNAVTSVILLGFKFLPGPF